MEDDLSFIFYHNVDPRRRQELLDSRMVQEDHNAMANLSGKFINQEYDANRYEQRLDMFNQNTGKRSRKNINITYPL